MQAKKKSRDKPVDPAKCRFIGVRSEGQANPDRATSGSNHGSITLNCSMSFTVLFQCMYKMYNDLVNLSHTNLNFMRYWIDLAEWSYFKNGNSYNNWQIPNIFRKSILARIHPTTIPSTSPKCLLTASQGSTSQVLWKCLMLKANDEIQEKHIGEATSYASTISDHLEFPWCHIDFYGTSSKSPKKIAPAKTPKKFHKWTTWTCVVRIGVE